MIVAGDEGTALPGEAEIVRLCRGSSDGRATPEDFALSSADKSSPVARLSVWCTALTTLEQADTLTERRFALAATLVVDEVRALRPHPDDTAVSALDVQWERARRLLDGVWLVVDEPGALGHAGIAALDQEGRDSRGQGLKAYRKSLRRRLADLANERALVPLRGAAPSLVG
ncbi:MAG: hypothetical protein IT382_00260 [Deltaproteobacteria bacterium]|nr:hypothetical protein [Deltaproteobacteria bacterium]